MMEMKCGVCGQISEFKDLVNLSKLEEGDLGGQPKFTGGASYESMVQRCPFCGYCNFDISENVLTANKLLQSENYEYLLHSSNMDEDIANMSAVAHIYECENKYLTASRAYSYASKMLEDKGETKSSIMYKEQEVRLLLLYISTDYFKKHFDIKVYQYLIDSLRRIKKFDKAIQFCDIALTKTYSSVQRNIFYLEKSLCMNYISKPHMFEESNGEFSNFYQILIGGFYASQSEQVYKDVHKKMRTYLEKCVYFPISEGADFIIKVDKAEYSGVDNLIVELRKTYDRVNGITAESEEVRELKLYPDPSETIKKETVNILTVSEMEKGKEREAKIKELQQQIAVLTQSNQALEEKLKSETHQKEILEHDIEINFADDENMRAELAKAQAVIADKEEKNAELAKELEEIIESRRVLTADFDTNMYSMIEKTESLQAEIQNLKEEIENSKQKEQTQIMVEPIEEQTEEPTNDENNVYSLQELFESEEIENSEESTISEQEYEEEANIENDNKQAIQPVWQMGESDFENQFLQDIDDEELYNELLENQEEYTEEDAEDIVQEIKNNEVIGENEEDMAEFVLDDITEEMILSIAKISGQIDVSEVQGMLLVGYKNAKFALDKIAGDGKLQEFEEDTYKYIEV